jgi:hypothetical protein
MATPAFARESVIEVPHLQTRVAATQEAIKRTRFALFLNALAAGAIIVCLWNTYISSDRDFAFEPFPYLSTAIPAQSSQPMPGASAPPGSPSRQDVFARDGKETYRQLMPQQFKAWVDSQYVAVNLLGIRISVSDFAFLGTIGLNFFLFYYLLCVRRENREIGILLQDLCHTAITPQGTIDASRLCPAAYTTYSAVASYMVFNLNRRDDTPIHTLAEPKHSQKLIGIRFFSHLLSWASFLAIIAILVCDYLSGVHHGTTTFFASPFRLDPDLFRASTADRKIYYFCMVGLSMVMAGWALYMTVTIRRYSDATRNVLEEFRSHLVTAGYLQGEASNVLARPSSPGHEKGHSKNRPKANEE